MFSSMTCSRIGRAIAVTAMAAAAVALVPRQASAFVMGVGCGGMMGGGGNQNYGSGARGHVPGYFGSDYGGNSRTTEGGGGGRATQGGGGRHAPHGGFAGRDGSRGGIAKRHEPHGGLAGRDAATGAGSGTRFTKRGGLRSPGLASNGGAKPGVAAHPATSPGRGLVAAPVPQAAPVATYRQPQPVPSFEGTAPRGQVRQFGRLGPAAAPVAPAAVAPPPVAAIPAPTYQPPTYQPPTYQPPAVPAPAAPVAANRPPAYPTYQPAAPVGTAPPQPAPQAFVAKAPSSAPVATPQSAPVEGAPAACAMGSYVTVAFQANVTTEDVKTFLAAYNVVIASGPEADGSYKIQLSACPLTPAEMTQVVDSMRSQTAIIARVGA